ncbi:MAG: hypothetical protein VKS61_01095 [Candidatus Sericytochromatia bacterium]|jgi:hypothetical protein|nr:hypothetical protein [Candidatus Sericytochromatia bacterium]
MSTHALFVPHLFLDDLEADGLSPETAKMKVHERKKDVRRIEGALEALGVPFKHEKVGTSATLTAAEVEALRAILPPALPGRCDLDLHPIA